MQRTNFLKTPLLNSYSTISFTILVTAIVASLIAYISTSWALAKDSLLFNDTNNTHIESIIASSVASNTEKNELNATIGGAATTESPLQKGFSPSRVPNLNAFKEDLFLSPLDQSAKPAVFSNKPTSPAEVVATIPNVLVTPLSPQVLAKSVSQLTEDSEYQRQQAVVKFLTAKPSILEVETPNHRKMVLKSINYKTTNRASLYVNQQEVMQFRSSLGFLTPFLRSKQAAHRLQLFLRNNGSYNDIQVVASETGLVLKLGESTIATVDAKTAGAMGVSVDYLAATWKQKLRQALGETPAYVTPIWVKKPIEQSGRYLAQGLASWYGPGFHGRLAADGSRFNQHSLTAAHKTLPFGTKLKVTNQRTGQSCVVKVTDRGPFVGHRVIDLSKGAAAAIGMLGSGVAKVRLEVLK
jgi:rare lipoprotein A